jgi:meso-butanediol dehydrogenase / (S,S)-butanediol dehydrogenase / diacetyl reductase
MMTQGTVPDLRLDGKVVLITGTGGGQGRAASLLFAAAGAVVVGCDIDSVTNGKTADLVAQDGGRMDASTVDISDPDRARAWVEDAAAKHGRIDVVYNNASHARLVPFAEMTVEDWRVTLANGLDALFFVTHAAWPHLIESQGIVINIASVSGHAGSTAAPQTAHCASKGGVLAFTRQLAVEGAPLGVRAVSISPGLIETPGTRELLQDETTRGIMLADALIKRAGRPEEVATLALFLASGVVTYITGSDYLVDGGRQAI